MSSLKLSSTYTIDAAQYASQGNSILGIRDAGKTYTAMKAAEELLDNKISIICFDPVGIWKNLKIGTGKHKGYPVVVAGGEGSDIILNINNAKDIVRAAMKENVSLVIDLYSPELINKSTWIKVVQETVDLLMYENKTHGLRHIFLEEAAEFIPQRLQPQHSKVYASIERLARMGRNARLGYTLINQRAEEVNKAILEISALMFLHRQVGKNSIASIQKWLELMQVNNAKDIIKSLPDLKQGECWAIGNNQAPKLIKILKRNTFHPDPTKNEKDASIASVTKIDVGAFVDKLNKQLQPKEATKTHSPEKLRDALSQKVNPQLTQDLAESKKLAASYKKELDDLYAYNFKNAQTLVKLAEQIQDIAKFFSNKKLDLSKLKVTETKNKIELAVPVIAIPANETQERKLGKCAKTILMFLAQYSSRSFTKPQICIATNYRLTSGGVANAFTELNTSGLIKKYGDRIGVNTNVDLYNWIGNVVHKAYSIDTFKSQLGKCEREIFDVLLQHPNNQFTREELVDNTPTKYSSTSGGVANAITILNTLELIKKESGLIKLNPELKDFLE